MSYTDLQVHRNVKVESNELENSPMGLHEVYIKEEPVRIAQEEQNMKDKLDLYADHEIKEEIVIGPVVLQTTDIAQN
ncbi:uncharacterized protein LOC113238406 [Hyposmocoma kahamanoa]|uniref:uncharacterized protein LOC113238406 n=1 Tax=Hyposmocoma kahamanoa TaxID=1477025 RepID=UPI000E6D6E78|nr:uncharacterized protein LOC113238406 [Hyposmocoma kahamanoa]